MKKLIVALLLLALPMSVMAMDAVTNAELDGVAGQAGVTVAFGGTSTTTISFSQLSWGDPGGVAGTCGNSIGWLIVDGAISIEQIIGCGERLVLDIGTTGGTSCLQNACCSIPSGTTFISVGLPDITTNVNVPPTLYIGLANGSGTIDGTLGVVYLQNLTVDTNTPGALYIWAH